MDQQTVCSYSTFLFLAILANYCIEITICANEVERIVDIEKFPKDQLLYRGLQLKNGIKVVLVHDESAKKSAACLSIGMGGLNDHAIAPGLANFVGHAVMVASQNYPAPNGFSKFVNNRGGTVETPVTVENEQYFSFDIKSEHFAAAMDRFAQCFLKPKFLSSPTVLGNALEDLEFQYTQRKEMDEFRVMEVKKILCKHTHKYCSFFAGSVESLHDKVRKPVATMSPVQEAIWLRDNVYLFYNTWYSSNIMTLAVLGKESLDDLQKLVIRLFKKFKDKKAIKLRYPFKFHPYGPGQLKFKIFVVPVEDENTNKMSLTFSVEDFSNQYRTDPSLYAEYLILNEAPGTLLSILRKRGLCTSLEFAYDSIAGIAFVYLDFELTKSGLDHINEIINLTFQYIRMVQESGIREEIFNEIKVAHDRTFPNCMPDNENIRSYVQSIANDMQEGFPIEKCLITKFLADTWNYSIIHKFISQLKPDRMNVTIISKSFKEKAHKVEEYYGTNYEIEKIPEDVIKHWSSKQSIRELRLPPINDFIPENFEVYPINESDAKKPYIIHKSPISEIWFKQDDEYRTPALTIQFQLSCSEIRTNSLGHGLWRLFYIMLKPILDERLFTSQISGLVWMKWNIHLHDNGMFIFLHGFNDKLPKYLDRLLFALTNMEKYITKESFDASVEEVSHVLKKMTLRNQSTLQHFYLHYLILSNKWSREVLYNTVTITHPPSLLVRLSYERRCDFNKPNIVPGLQLADMKKFLKKVFRQIFIRGLIFGNCTKKRALEIVTVLEGPFQSSNRMLPQEMLEFRDVEIGFHNQYHILGDKNNLFSYFSYFQFDTHSRNPDNLTARLLYIIIEEDCRTFINANQDVYPKTECIYLDNGLQISVLGQQYLGTVDKKVEKFFRLEVPTNLRLLGKERFESYKKKVENKHIRSHCVLTLSEKYWFEIGNQFYKFNRMEDQLRILNSLNMNDIMDFVEKMFSSSSPSRRKLSVYSFPRNFEQAKPGMVKRMIPPGSKIFKDVDIYKMTSKLLAQNLCLPPAESD